VRVPNQRGHGDNDFISKGYLRKKVDAGAEKKLIHTVWGTGWVLKEE